MTELLTRPAEDLSTSPSPDQRRWLALAVIAAAQLMVVLDISIVTIALPSAQHALHISTANRQWVVTAYTIAFGGLLLLGGRISDLMGRKRMFIVGLLGFAGASALGGAAQNSAMLFGARALQGGFAAVMAPAALSLLSITFTETTERAKAFGVYGAVSGAGAAIGLIVGGTLTDFASWRWCLFVNVPISLLAALAAVRLVHESRSTGNGRYDVPGAIAVTAGLLALVYGFSRASVDGWTSATTIVFLAVSTLSLVAFVGIEVRSRHPLLPLSVVLDRNRGGSFLTMFFVGVGLLGMFLFCTYYFQGTLHYSALKTGFAFLPFSGGVIVAAALASSALPRVGPRPMMVGGLLAAAAGQAWLTQIGVHTAYVNHVMPAEVVMSMGLGFAFVPMSSTALFGTGEGDAGVASATLTASQQIGGSLGTALLNTLYVTATTSFVASHGPNLAAVAAAQVHGYTVGFTFGAAAMAIAAVVSFVFIRNEIDKEKVNA